MAGHKAFTVYLEGQTEGDSQIIRESPSSSVSSVNKQELYIPKVYIDCNKPTGGIQTHIKRLTENCNVDFVGSPGEADVIHYHFGGREPNPTIATCHGFYTDRFIVIHKEIGTKINNHLQDTFSKCKQVISVSNWVRDGIKDKWGIDSVVVRNKIDNFQYSCQDYGEFIFFAGYVCPEKNLDDIFRVAELLPEYQFVGIVNHVEDWPVLPNVKLLPYPQPHSVVIDLLSRCRFLINTSIQEAGPIIILEAFAASKGVVCFDSVGTNEVTTKKNSIAVEEKNIDKLAAACKAMWENPEKWGKEAKLSGWQHDIRLNAAKVEQIYRKNQWPTISMLCLAYKNRDTLQKTITSLPEWVEVIIGDCDGTHKDLVPKRCKYVRVENVAPGANRNKLLPYATGTYLGVLDCDDIRLPGTLEYQLKYMIDNDISCTVGGCYRDNNGDILWNIQSPQKIHIDEFKRGNPAAHCSILVRKSVIDVIGGYDGGLDYTEDYDIFWRLVKACGITRLPTISYIWHFNPTGRSRDPEQEKKWLKIVYDKNM